MCDPLFSSCKENKTYAHLVFENPSEKKRRVFCARKKEQRKADPLHLGFAGFKRRDRDLLQHLSSIHQWLQVQIGLMPVVHAEDCAKAIVDAACRGDRYVTQPAWFRVLYLLRVFAPELVEWWFRVMHVTGPGKSDMDTPSKKILDMTGAKHILYPSSIQTAEHKED